MVNAAYALNQYCQSKVTTTSNPVELIIMLYDGAIEFLNKAATGIKMKNLHIKIMYIDKTMAILKELDTCLNYEKGGEIAFNLHDLYCYMMKELVLANIDYDADKLMHIRDLLQNLRKGWVEIKDKA